MSALTERAATPRAKSVYSLRRLLLALACGLPFLYPFGYLMALALRSQAQFRKDPNSFFPVQLDLVKISEAWTRGAMGVALTNSLLAVCIGVVVLLFSALPAAYWLFLRNDRRSAVFRGAMVGLMSFPTIAIVIPLFIMLSRFGSTNSLVVLGLVYGAFNTPFGVFFIWSYMKSGFPPGVIEAAQIDGAGSWTVFRSIVVPIVKPAISTLAALAFVWTWGDLLMSVVLIQDAANRTAMVAISDLNGRLDNLDIQLNAAAALIGLLPVLPVLLFAQTALRRGFVVGSDK